MGKATNARRKAPSPVEKLDGPTPEQLAKGGYNREDFIHADLGQRVTAHINRGGTPYMRWKDTGRLTDTQIAAIDHVVRLWGIAGTERSITANYGERIPGSGDNERRAINEIEARKDLHRIQGYIPGRYFDLFENVIRWDEPAGIAGGRLGFGGRSAIDRAHTVVCFVADVIAMNERL